MALTKFVVHSALHHANQNSFLRLSQNGEKLIHEMNLEMETFEKFSSNFI